MSIQGFRGNCDSLGKLGMCPSLAEPDSGGFPRSNVSNHEPQATEKFFDPTIFQKCWRGSGRVALIAARRQRNPVPSFWHTERVVRKATAFRGRANKTAPPCETLAIIWYLATVPGEQLQRKCLIENLAPRDSDFQHPAKGGSTPAFACQRAAIAPLPCLNLHP